MRVWAAILMLGLALPAFAHDARMDKCGCHNQYGLRHCHPTKRTKQCEAPVSSPRKPPPVRPIVIHI